jgi:hypothetical protein
LSSRRTRLVVGVTVARALLGSDLALADTPEQPGTTPLTTEATQGSQSATHEPDPSKEGFGYDPDAGITFRAKEFKWTTWGFAERLFNFAGADTWRRVRQGMEFDFPRIAPKLRPVFVYEVDFTDNDFFRKGPKWKIFENLFVALQDADDPAQFRVLVGQNTHIISREDNLSSGNLPTINRALVLEEHGSMNNFGTQFGVQAVKAFSPRYTLALSAQDNRGSFNQDKPRYVVGNSLATKLRAIALEKPEHQVTYGVGLDYTFASIDNGSFNLISPIGQKPLGGVEASGGKVTVEADIAYAFRLFTRPTTLETEGLFSDYAGTWTSIVGSSTLFQFSVFDAPWAGDLDPFVRYDVVSLGESKVHGRAIQQALRTGANYNLPFTQKLLNFHAEYGFNSIDGPAAIVPVAGDSGEFRLELRANLTRYLRH